MSLYIEGMQLPEIKPNSSVKMELRNLDGEITVGIMTGGYSCCEQWTHYPIIEVTEPHGKLGDLDDLIKMIDISIDIDGEENARNVTKAFNETLDTIRGMTPVIEEEDE